jgi:hypothetical protein
VYNIKNYNVCNTHIIECTDTKLNLKVHLELQAKRSTMKELNKFILNAETRVNENSNMAMVLHYSKQSH